MEQRTFTWLWAAGLGAGVMFMLDPERGRRRRAVAVDRVVHTTHVLANRATATGRDLRHRAAGTIAKLRRAASVLREDHASDQVIEARVRSAVGRVVSHPGSVAVGVNDATVTLDGPIFASEAPGLRSTVRRVRGIRRVDDRLNVHDTAGHVPGLQGGVPRVSRARARQTWSPTVRLVSSAGTIALLTWGAMARRRRHAGSQAASIFDGPVW